MDRPKSYRTNRLPASIVTVLFIALIFTIDIDKLSRFYEDIELTMLIAAAVLVMPTIAFFGFAIKLFRDRIVYRYNVFFRKEFKIDDLSHILYQPTWRGIMPLDSQTDMRSLHIVRHSGGWGETISLANGAFKEEDLADIAKTIRQLNHRVALDEHAEALIKKYERRDGRSFTEGTY